jgi:general stress protein 26
VSITGRGTVVRDRAKAKELWTELHRAWFPDGLDDPNLALLRVDVTTPSSGTAPAARSCRRTGS